MHCIALLHSSLEISSVQFQHQIKPIVRSIYYKTSSYRSMKKEINKIKFNLFELHCMHAGVLLCVVCQCHYTQQIVIMFKFIIALIATLVAGSSAFAPAGFRSVSGIPFLCFRLLRSYLLCAPHLLSTPARMCSLT